jgi:regulator of replication initiation timing
MDERKLSIRELEEKRGETRENLKRLLGTWGEALLARLDAENSDRFPGELGQYRHFLETIALSRGHVRTLEENALRLRNLEKELEARGAAAAEKTGALTDLYARLGKTALSDDGTFAVEASLKAQADDLATRIAARQEQIGELEEGKNANIFSWIGNNTRGALIRSRLSKNLADLDRLHASLGEQIFEALERLPDGPGELPAEDIPAQIRALRQDLAFLEESRGTLRDQRETLRDSLGIEGNTRNFNAAKKIRETEQRIAREQEQLADLCAAFGNQLCELFAGRETGKSDWLQAEDRLILERSRELLGQIAGYGAAIEKLRASLRIDEKRNAIDKMKKSILNHRQRIAASENAISGLEKQIAESNRHIDELMKL